MSVKRIFSAGGIVLRLRSGSSIPSHRSGHRLRSRSDSRRSSIDQPEYEVLVTQHSKHKGWDFPKGHIELGESAEQAAIRETEEETGVVGEIIEKVGQTEYFYYEDGKRIFKTVVYFLMKHVKEGEATTAFEVSDMVWLPVGEVEEKLTFKDTKRLWNEVLPRIKRLELRD